MSDEAELMEKTLMKFQAEHQIISSLHGPPFWNWQIIIHMNGLKVNSMDYE